MRTLEDILRNFTKTTKPLFLKRPYRDIDGYPVTLNKTGYKAYSKLVATLYDLANYIRDIKPETAIILCGLVDTLDYEVNSVVY